MFKRSILVLLVVVGCGDNGESDLPPEFASSHLEMSVEENGALVIDASATDPADRPLSYTTTAPLHGALSGTAPHYTYTPEAGFAGSDEFTITVSNGVAELAIPVHITVHHIDVAPVAADQQVSTFRYTPVAITLAASDVDSASLSYAIVAAPASGVLSGTPPDVTYTPTGGFYGTDTFTFAASDGEKTSSAATVTVTVGGCGPGFTHGGSLCVQGL